MADYFLGEIRVFPFAFAPEDWALCNGAVMQVRQSQALFSLLGNRYGGDGQTTFKLPDLQGRVPISAGTSPTTDTAYKVGDTGGEEGVALEGPHTAHHHEFGALTTGGVTAQPAGCLLATAPATGTDPQVQHPIYGSVGSADNLVALNLSSIQLVGSGQAHNNVQPFLVVNFCISTTGLYPQKQ